MKTALLTIVVIQLLLANAYSWSAPGHEAIAQAALQMLKGTPAEVKINTILNGEAPADAAVWLDRVRENFKFPDPNDAKEAAAFKKAFPNNSDWHFCNFIVGSTNYDFGSKYASSNDVVHGLEAAISALEGSPSKMTQRQALRSIIHLVGDIHQPLHCITGFYDLTDMNNPILLKDVADPGTAIQDRGGNQLMYTASENLHHFWDLVLPNGVSSDVNTLASKIAVASLNSQPLTDGDFHHWPETWASLSMQQANAAYDGITYNSAAFVDDPRHPGQKMLQIQITLPGGEPGYKAAQQQRAQDQLTQAAVHLAQLLSKINFQ
jgi:hypothetical protein